MHDGTKERKRREAQRAASLAEGRAFYRIADLCARYGVTRVTIWDWWARQRIMPPPVPIGSNTKGWPVALIHDFEARRAGTAA